MTSTSLVRPAISGQPIHPYDPISVELDTAVSIARLTLDDITRVDDARKGKMRADAPLSDEEYAFQIQRELLEDTLRVIDDYKVANTLDVVLETDFSCLTALAIMEQAATEDHEAALALSRGGPLPPPSRSQRLLGDPAFSMPEPNTGPATHIPLDIPQQNLHLQVRDDDTQYSIATVVGPTTQPSRTQCISCGDLVRGTKGLRGPCGHDYCRDCIIELVDACTRDESLYPPRCCGQSFTYDDLVPMLSVQLRFTFDSRRWELDIPATCRIYCPTSSCSAFLGSSADTTKSITCRKCMATVCSMCSQPAHYGENCSENAATLEVRELARNERWQTCPACKAIIELHQGCYHMTCRCRAQFCYLCAAPWKNCRCRQWDEVRLLDVAEHRVENVIGVRARAAHPVVFEERVQRMADTLRRNHNCDQHYWRRQAGRARCEECQCMLHEFILVCTDCALTVCLRCARNRLA